MKILALFLPYHHGLISTEKLSHFSEKERKELKEIKEIKEIKEKKEQILEMNEDCLKRLTEVISKKTHDKIVLIPNLNHRDLKSHIEDYRTIATFLTEQLQRMVTVEPISESGYRSQYINVQRIASFFHHVYHISQTYPQYEIEFFYDYFDDREQHCLPLKKQFYGLIDRNCLLIPSNVSISTDPQKQGFHCRGGGTRSLTSSLSGFMEEAAEYGDDEFYRFKREAELLLEDIKAEPQSKKRSKKVKPYTTHDLLVMELRTKLERILAKNYGPKWRTVQKPELTELPESHVQEEPHAIKAEDTVKAPSGSESHLPLVEQPPTGTTLVLLIDCDALRYNVHGKVISEDDPGVKKTTINNQTFFEVELCTLSDCLAYPEKYIEKSDYQAGNIITINQAFFDGLITSINQDPPDRVVLAMGNLSQSAEMDKAEPHSPSLQDYLRIYKYLYTKIECPVIFDPIRDQDTWNYKNSQSVGDDVKRQLGSPPKVGSPPKEVPGSEPLPSEPTGLLPIYGIAHQMAALFPQSLIRIHSYGSTKRKIEQLFAIHPYHPFHRLHLLPRHVILQEFICTRNPQNPLGYTIEPGEPIEGHGDVKNTMAAPAVLGLLMYWYKALLGFLQISEEENVRVMLSELEKKKAQIDYIHLDMPKERFSLSNMQKVLDDLIGQVQDAQPYHADHLIYAPIPVIDQEVVKASKEQAISIEGSQPYNADHLISEPIPVINQEAVKAAKEQAISIEGSQPYNADHLISKPIPVIDQEAVKAAKEQAISIEGSQPYNADHLISEPIPVINQEAVKAAKEQAISQAKTLKEDLSKRTRLFFWKPKPKIDAVESLQGVLREDELSSQKVSVWLTQDSNKVDKKTGTSLKNIEVLEAQRSFFFFFIPASKKKPARSISVINGMVETLAAAEKPEEDHAEVISENENDKASANKSNSY